MFKLVIVDSDWSFVSSMRSFLDWEALNFKIRATFTDSESLLTFLRNHYVDAVLISAEMPAVSGMEVVKICYEEMHPAKFILMSENEGIENIRTAIRHGVFDYLTKPLDYASLKDCFIRLKKQLKPDERADKHSVDDVRSPSDELFSDLLSGRIKNPVDLSLRLRKAELEDTIIHRECALVNIHINSFSRWLTMCWSYGIGKFYQTFADSFPKSTDKADFIFTRIFYNNIELICINKSQTPITKLLSEYIPEFSHIIMEVFGVYSEVDVTKIFSSVAEIMKFNLQEPVKSEIKSEEVIENAIKFIRHNYFRDITLEDVSKYVALSREYFCSYYKQKTGEKFIDTLNKLRIENSKKLLINTTLNISQVAESVGYRSASYFHKTFKQISGVSPTEFRKQNVINKK